MNVKQILFFIKPKKILIAYIFIILSILGSIFGSFMVRIITDVILFGFFVLIATNVAKKKYSLPDFTWETWKIGVIYIALSLIYYLPLAFYTFAEGHPEVFIEKLYSVYSTEEYAGSFFIGIDLSTLLRPFYFLSFIISFFLPAALVIYGVKRKFVTSLNLKVVVKLTASVKYIFYWFLASFLDKIHYITLNHFYQIYQTKLFLHEELFIILFLGLLFILLYLQIFKYILYGMGLQETIARLEEDNLNEK